MHDLLGHYVPAVPVSPGAMVPLPSRCGLVTGRNAQMGRNLLDRVAALMQAGRIGRYPSVAAFTSLSMNGMESLTGARALRVFH